MIPRVRDLTPERLDELPDRCRSCVFWEVPGARRGPAGEAGARLKDAWVDQAWLTWGAPGAIAVVQGRTVGYVLITPPGAGGNTGPGPDSPSQDALMLATMWVDPEWRGARVGRLLLIHALSRAQRMGLRAVEAHGLRGPLPGTCVLSGRFLRAHGFVVLRTHLRWPLLRFDLRQASLETRSAAPRVSEALLRLRRRPAAPAPGLGISAPQELSGP